MGNTVYLQAGKARKCSRKLMAGREGMVRAGRIMQCVGGLILQQEEEIEGAPGSEMDPHKGIGNSGTWIAHCSKTQTQRKRCAVKCTEKFDEIPVGEPLQKHVCSSLLCAGM